MEANRTSDVKRNTQETKIEISLDLDGQKAIEINSGIPFFDHMLNAFAKHGGFGLRLHCDGDLEIDAHHSMEDIGLALGQALRTALGDKRGITRFGHSYVPLDESLARTVIDLSGRPHLSWRANFPEAEAGGVIVNTAFIDYVMPDDQTTGSLQASVESPVGVEGDHCVRLELGPDENGEMQYRIDRCEMHLTLEVDCEAGIEAAADDAARVEALKRAVERWTESVQNEYTAIIGSTTDAEAQALLSGERDAFMAWIEMHGAKLLEENPEDEGAALRAVLDDLMERCADLCEIHHTCPAGELYERVMKTAAFIEGYLTE